MSNYGFVYVLEAQGVAEGLYKIGHSKDVKKRIRSFVKLPFPVNLIHKIKVPDARALESKIHQYFSSSRANGEWFYLTDEDIKFLKGVKSVDDVHIPDVTYNKIVVPGFRTELNLEQWRILILLPGLKRDLSWLQLARVTGISKDLLYRYVNNKVRYVDLDVLDKLVKYARLNGVETSVCDLLVERTGESEPTE